MSLNERKIIEIDESKCNGCGLCVTSCAEGAIQMVNGKAKLVSDTYCDGLGACLVPCPTGALSLVTRPAAAFDAEAAEKHVEAMKKKTVRIASVSAPAPAAKLGCGCPGSMSRSLKEAPAAKLACGCPGSMSQSLKEAPAASACCCEEDEPEAQSELMNWPLKLRLIPPQAPYLKGADLLLLADCAGVASPDLHRRFLASRPVAIACPKFDTFEDQADKLAEIIRVAEPASITVVRMEVPCCGGLVRIAEEAIRRSGKNIPLERVILGADGQVK